MTRVLIVDEAAFMRQLLKQIVSQGGYECTVAGSGREAIAAYPHLRPDVVTLDITMPDTDAIETVRELKTRHPGAKIIVCATMGEEAKLLAAIQAGATDFLVKPFKPERVLQALAKTAG